MFNGGWNFSIGGCGATSQLVLDKHVTRKSVHSCFSHHHSSISKICEMDAMMHYSVNPCQFMSAQVRVSFQQFPSHMLDAPLYPRIQIDFRQLNNAMMSLITQAIDLVQKHEFRIVRYCIAFLTLICARFSVLFFFYSFGRYLFVLIG
jgi:hypothetical protein